MPFRRAEPHALQARGTLPWAASVLGAEASTASICGFGQALTLSGCDPSPMSAVPLSTSGRAVFPATSSETARSSELRPLAILPST